MINSFASKVISLSLVASALGGGSYYFYSINSPTNVEELLKWNGYSLASQDNTWKAILAENKENWTFIGEIDKNNLTTSASKLKAKYPPGGGYLRFFFYSCGNLGINNK